VREIVDTDHIAPIRVSVAEAVTTVLDRIPPKGTVTFRELAADAETRLDVIVRFLAVLELFKQGIVDLEQLSNFATLTVRRLAAHEQALDATSIADWDEATPEREPEPR
jgi:segregation and condensation protein A